MQILCVLQNSNLQTSRKKTIAMQSRETSCGTNNKSFVTIVASEDLTSFPLECSVGTRRYEKSYRAEWQTFVFRRRKWISACPRIVFRVICISKDGSIFSIFSSIPMFKHFRFLLLFIYLYLWKSSLQNVRN